MAHPEMHSSTKMMQAEWILKLAEFVGPRIPSYLRRIPDLRDDYANDGDFKIAVPFYSQADWYSCGPVAASMVVETFHPHADFAALYRACRPEPLVGTSAPKIVRALRRFGVGVSVRRNLGFDSLATAIESGFPIIAGVACGEDGHWVVVYGVNRRERRLFVSNVGLIGHSRQECTWREWKSWWDPAGDALVCWGKRLCRHRR